MANISKKGTKFGKYRLIFRIKNEGEIKYKHQSMKLRDKLPFTEQKSERIKIYMSNILSTKKGKHRLKLIAPKIKSRIKSRGIKAVVKHKDKEIQRLKRSGLRKKSLKIF